MFQKSAKDEKQAKFCETKIRSFERQLEEAGQRLLLSMEEAVQEEEEESDADYDTEDENEKQARLGRPGAAVASFVASHLMGTPVRVLMYD